MKNYMIQLNLLLTNSNLIGWIYISMYAYKCKYMAKKNIFWLTKE